MSRQGLRQEEPIQMTLGRPQTFAVDPTFGGAKKLVVALGEFSWIDAKVQ